MNPVGRPKTSALPRAEQLRRAKRAQRERERSAGFALVQLKLPRKTAEKLAAASRIEEFAGQLDLFLDELVLRVADYPALADIAWNRGDAFIPAREALSLYERNWRFVDSARLTPHERALIDRLVERFGAGVLHV